MTIYFKNGFYGTPVEGGVALTDEQYKLLMDGQSQGKQIVTDLNGNPVLTEPSPSIYHKWMGSEWVIPEAKKAELKAQKLQQLTTAIDDKAARIYSVWTRFEQEYTSREEAAKAFKDANYEGDVSRFIADFAEKAGIDNKTAADLILIQAEGLRKLLVELANQRMRKYELKKDGLTEDEMQAIYDDIIQQMEKLAEAYQNG